MIKLLEAGPNNINTVKTNKVVSWKTIIIKSAAEANKINKKGLKKNANATVILPMITKLKDAKEEADFQNIINQTIVGVKEGVINSLIWIVGGGILDAVTMTPDGSDYRNINNYTLHKVLQVAIKHASQPEVDNVRKMLVGLIETEFAFRKLIHLNMQTLKETATRIAQFGVVIDKPILTIILLAEVHKAEKQEWGQEFCITTSNIKKKLNTFTCTTQNF